MDEDEEDGGGVEGGGVVKADGGLEVRERAEGGIVRDH